MVREGFIILYKETVYNTISVELIAFYINVNFEQYNIKLHYVRRLLR